MLGSKDPASSMIPLAMAHERAQENSRSMEAADVIGGGTGLRRWPQPGHEELVVWTVVPHSGHPISGGCALPQCGQLGARVDSLPPHSEQSVSSMANRCYIIRAHSSLI
jgi:hypothetical protein